MNFKVLIPDFRKSNWVGLIFSVLAFVFTFIPFAAIKVADSITSLVMAEEPSAGVLISNIKVNMNFYQYNWLAGLVLACIIVSAVCFLYNDSDFQKIIAMVTSFASVVLTIISFVSGPAYVDGIKRICKKAMEMFMSEIPSYAVSMINSYMDTAIAKVASVGFILELIALVLMLAASIIMPIITKSKTNGVKPQSMNYQQMVAPQPMNYQQVGNPQMMNGNPFVQR